MSKKILIYGSKEFSLTVAELAVDCGYVIEGYVDDFNTGPHILGSLEQVSKTHPAADYSIAIAVGYNNLPARWAAWQRVNETGYRAPALVHPRAYVAASATVNAGALVMANALVDVRSNIGELAVLWPGACVNHDCKIGVNSFISPNATLCGYVELGDHCFVGAGSAIADHCIVPSSTFIKMLTKYTRAFN